MQVSSFESEVEVEVLAVEGGAASRMALTFRKSVHVYQGTPTETVLAGRTYVVDRAAPQVRDAKGEAASADETQRVLDAFPDLGTRHRIDEVLPDAPMRIGERRDDLARALLRDLHPRAWTLDSGTAVLSRADDEHATFAVTLEATSEAGLHMRVEGEAHLRLADGRLSALTLAGAYEVPDGHPAGSFSLRRTTAFVQR